MNESRVTMPVIPKPTIPQTRHGGYYAHPAAPSKQKGPPGSHHRLVIYQAGIGDVCSFCNMHFCLVSITHFSDGMELDQ
jgi:hypothetical protein